ncbi:hypothetical protein IHN58_12160, partial [Deinococcus sp. 12RED42]|nr:hypothetical protein [Deinococcus sp. 12RED42]
SGTFRFGRARGTGAAGGVWAASFPPVQAGECAAASAAAQAGAAVVVVGPENVGEALSAWMDRTPHGR